MKKPPPPAGPKPTSYTGASVWVGSSSSSSSSGACAGRGTDACAGRGIESSSKGACAGRGTSASSKGGCAGCATKESGCGTKSGKGACHGQGPDPGKQFHDFDFRSFGPKGRDGRRAAAALTFEAVDAAPLPDLSHSDTASWRSPPDGLIDQDVGCFRCHWTGHRREGSNGCPVCFHDAPVSGEPRNTRRTAWLEICKVVEGRDQPERLRVLEAVTLMSYGRIGFPEKFSSVEIVDNWLALTKRRYGGRLSHKEFLRIYECIGEDPGCPIIGNPWRN